MVGLYLLEDMVGPMHEFLRRERPELQEFATKGMDSSDARLARSMGEQLPNGCRGKLSSQEWITPLRMIIGAAGPSLLCMERPLEASCQAATGAVPFRADS
jgi:hypothetical protein